MNKRRSFFLVTAIFLLLFFVTADAYPQQQVSHPKAGKTIIVDTDMGLDDIRALMALLADSITDVHAILTVEGSASLGKGTDNLIGFLESNQIESIPVFKGYANHKVQLPAWRATANNAGGKTFPPPRHLSALDLTREVIADLIHHETNINILALGPLTNVAKMIVDYPQEFKNISHVWIPADIQDTELECWNLYYDIEAAKQTFNSKTEIEIIQIPDSFRKDIHRFLSGLNGDSRSVQWITATIAQNGRSAEHCLLYDELIAAAAIDENLLRRSDQKYTVFLNAQNRFELKADPRGNLHIAHLINVPAALDVLKENWQKNPISRHHHTHASLVPVRDLLRTFHGHLGPYVVIGYRMGKEALSILNSQGHFGLSAEVHSILVPPFSCLIDGVQLGSGCTLGKRNISIKETKDPAWSVFVSDNGEKTTIRLREEIPPLVKKYVDEQGVEAAGERMLDLKAEELFSVE